MSSYRVIVIDEPHITASLVNMILHDIGVRVAGHFLSHIVFQLERELKNTK